MEIKWHPEAIEEFLELDTETQKYLNQEIEKLPEKGLEWNKVEMVKNENLGLKAFRIRLDSENEKTNHRIIFDVKEESFFIVKIGKRPSFYDLENLEEAVERI